MKKLLFIILLTTTLRSQDQGFSPQDCALNSQGFPTASLPCTAPYTDTTMAYPSLRYGYGGGPLSYSLPFNNGPAIVTLKFSEPNKLAPGQRLFTFRVDNQIPQQIDIFKLSGGQKKALDISFPIIVANGVVNITFTAQVGNSLINVIAIQQLATNFIVSKWLTNPSGIQYLEVSGKVNGRFLAFNPDSSFTLDPTKWTSIP